jgi:PKHD-type hydroxylase
MHLIVVFRSVKNAAVISPVKVFFILVNVLGTNGPSMLNSPISYVTTDSVFTKDECNEIINKAKTTGYKTDGMLGGTIKTGEVKDKHLHVDESIRKTNIYFFSDTDIYNKIMPHIGHINREVKWNFSLQHFEALQLGEYANGGHYDWHVDENPYPYDSNVPPQLIGKVRKISFSILLNDSSEFTGGEFEIEDQLPGIVPRSNFITGLKNAGDMIVFPSFVPHKIHPVTLGTRYSLVGWICGEPWR